jgi:hypothetical protein
MRTDFKSWERSTLEQFARQVADEHLVLVKKIEAAAWRPVSTLPVGDQSQSVLMFNTNMPYQDVWQSTYFATDRRFGCSRRSKLATHWMPMPAGPVLPPSTDYVLDQEEIDSQLAQAAHVFKNDPMAMQYLDYIQALRDADSRKKLTVNVPDWSAS